MEELIRDYVKRNNNYEELIPQLMELYTTDDQFKEAVDNDYELFTYDEWKHFQRLIGTRLSFENFQIISSVLYEENIDIIDLPYKNRKV